MIKIVKPKGNTDALTSTERAICRSWDNNQSIERIARSLRLQRDYVSDVVSKFNEGDESRKHIKATRTGSAQLLAAMQAARAGMAA